MKLPPILIHSGRDLHRYNVNDIFFIRKSHILYKHRGRYYTAPPGLKHETMTKKELKQFIVENGDSMIECKGGKVFLLFKHWHYLNPITEAKRILLGKQEFKTSKPIIYVYQGSSFLS